MAASSIEVSVNWKNAPEWADKVIRINPNVIPEPVGCSLYWSNTDSTFIQRKDQSVNAGFEIYLDKSEYLVMEKRPVIKALVHVGAELMTSVGEVTIKHIGDNGDVCYSFDGVGDLHICQKAKSDDFFKTRPTREDELIKALPACINYLSDKKAVANLLIKAGYRKTHASDNALLRRISNHLLPQLSEQDGMMVALKSLAERLK